MNNIKFTSDRDIYERSKLMDVLPLNTPLVIFVEPSRTCDCRCNYCYHSFTKEKAKNLNVINKGIMEFDLFKKIIDDIKEFPNKIKCIHMTSRGESLLNKNLYDMISYAKSQNVAERLNLVTNGILLKPETNMKLINSGIDSIKISIQALTEEEYLKVSNVEINLQLLIYNIKHLYTNMKIYNNMNNKDCKLYIKICDISIKNEEDKQKFYETYSSICDGISIEHIFDTDRYLKLNNYNNVRNNVTMYNKHLKPIDICPMPFYMLNIGFDGNVIPCCYYRMISFGNLKNMKIKELWNGNVLKLFRHSLLNKNEITKLLCDDCNIPNFNIYEKDNIDNCTEQLIKFYE